MYSILGGAFIHVYQNELAVFTSFTLKSAKRTGQRSIRILLYPERNFVGGHKRPQKC